MAAYPTAQGDDRQTGVGEQEGRAASAVEDSAKSD